MDESAKIELLIETAERPEHDEVFERLARGELSKSEEMALRTAEDPETRRLYELFRPLDAQARQRFDDAVRQTFPNQARGVSSHPSWWSTRSRATRVALVSAPALALAAALAIFVMSPREPEIASSVKLHSFEPLVQHTDRGTSWLGTSPQPAPGFALMPGTCWNVQLRTAAPTGRLPKPGSVHTYFTQANSAVVWEVAWVPQKNGALAPEGGCAKLPALATGPWELIVLSGRDAPRPDPMQATAVCRSGPPTGAGWRCDREAVQILPTPSVSP